MDEEKGVLWFLKDGCFTTEEEKDLLKPFILKGDRVFPNPYFIPNLAFLEAREAEIQGRKTNLGTSFVLNFDPLCQAHQLKNKNGDYIRFHIAGDLRDRLFRIIRIEAFPAPSFVLDVFENSLEVAICKRKQPGFNNGEVYLWLIGISLKEDFVWKVLMKLKASLEENPIEVYVKSSGELHKVWFYGWGFPHY